MRNFQLNLLIVLSVCLCGLCAYQWYSQSVERTEFITLNDLLNHKNVAIQDYTNSINDLQHQVSQMDDGISQLRGTIKTNENTMLAQRRELNRLAAENDGLTNQIAQYRQAVDTLQAKLKELSDGINKQNEAIKELITQRDDLVNKYNESINARNEIVRKYNDLVAKIEQARPGGSK